MPSHRFVSPPWWTPKAGGFLNCFLGWPPAVASRLSPLLSSTLLRFSPPPFPFPPLRSAAAIAASPTDATPCAPPPASVFAACTACSIASARRSVSALNCLQREEGDACQTSCNATCHTIIDGLSHACSARAALALRWTRTGKRTCRVALQAWGPPREAQPHWHRRSSASMLPLQRSQAGWARKAKKQGRKNHSATRARKGAPGCRGAVRLTCTVAGDPPLLCSSSDCVLVCSCSLRGTRVCEHSVLWGESAGGERRCGGGNTATCLHLDGLLALHSALHELV